MPSFSGVWNLVSQYQAKANLQWPQAPGAPTSVSALLLRGVSGLVELMRRLPHRM
jgi:hypothetical protein